MLLISGCTLLKVSKCNRRLKTPPGTCLPEAIDSAIEIERTHLSLGGAENLPRSQRGACLAYRNVAQGLSLEQALTVTHQQRAVQEA